MRYQVTWSAADGEYVGLVDAFPSLSWLDPTAVGALAGIKRLVAEVVADMDRSGERATTEEYIRWIDHVDGDEPPAGLDPRKFAALKREAAAEDTSDIAALREAKANDDGYRISASELNPDA